MHKGFLRDEKGAAVTELAMVSPLLLVMGLGMLDAWSLIATQMNQFAAVRTGAMLALSGVKDEERIREQALEAWVHKPDNAKVQVTSICACLNLVQDCTVNSCSDGAPPSMHLKITAKVFWEAPFDLDFFPISHEITRGQAIRVR